MTLKLENRTLYLESNKTLLGNTPDYTFSRDYSTELLNPGYINVNLLLAILTMYK